MQYAPDGPHRPRRPYNNIIIPLRCGRVFYEQRAHRRIPFTRVLLQTDDDVFFFFPHPYSLRFFFLFYFLFFFRFFPTEKYKMSIEKRDPVRHVCAWRKIRLIVIISMRAAPRTRIYIYCMLTYTQNQTIYICINVCLYEKKNK